MTAPAARSHSGWCTAIALTPASPPASSSAAQVNRTSRRRPGIGSRAGSSPAARASATSTLDDPELEGDHVLHVDRAAAVDVAVGDVAGERVVGPAVGRRGHDVEVGQQQERVAAGAVAAQPDVDRAATGDRLDDLRLEAEVGQAVREIARDARLAVGADGRWRVDRRDPDEVAEGLDEAGVGGVPGRRRDGVRRSRHRGRVSGHRPDRPGRGRCR